MQPSEPLSHPSFWRRSLPLAWGPSTSPRAKASQQGHSTVCALAPLGVESAEPAPPLSPWQPHDRQVPGEVVKGWCSQDPWLSLCVLLSPTFPVLQSQPGLPQPCQQWPGTRGC
jgi:hypothetical protein